MAFFSIVLGTGPKPSGLSPCTGRVTSNREQSGSFARARFCEGSLFEDSSKGLPPTPLEVESSDEVCGKCTDCSKRAQHAGRSCHNRFCIIEFDCEQFFPGFTLNGGVWQKWRDVLLILKFEISVSWSRAGVLSDSGHESRLCSSASVGAGVRA